MYLATNSACLFDTYFFKYRSDKIRVTRAQSSGAGHKNDSVLKVKQF